MFKTTELKFILLSLIIHILFICVLINSIPSENLNIKTKEIVEVSFIKQFNNTNNLKNKLNSKFKNKISNETVGKNETNQFKPKFSNFIPSKIKTSDSSLGSGVSAYKKNAQASQEEFLSMGRDESLENEKFYQEIYKRINNELSYPQEFIDLGIKGKVYVECIVNEKGKILKSDNISFYGKNKSLELFTINLVSKVLLNSENKTKLLFKQKSKLKMEFDFTNEFETSINSKGNSFRNVLKFIRVARMQNALEKVYAKSPGIIPVVLPVPPYVLVMVDFIQLNKFIKEYNKPSENYRNSLKVEQLLQGIKQSEISMQK